MLSTSHGRRSGRLAVALIATAGFVAACSGSLYGGASSPPATGSGSPKSTVYRVSVAQDAKLGAYLSGEDGRTLYVLTTDSAGAGTCTGQCAVIWPPFTLDAGESVQAGQGVTGKLATFTRAEGTTQVSYAGAPLYYFSGDTAAGDVKGQGKNGVWFVVSPTGEPNRRGSAASGSTAAPAASVSPTTGSGTTATATIVDYAFNPVSLTVSAGTTVTWKNTGSRSHTVTADGGSFGSGALGSGSTFTFGFSTAGTFTYHCAIHPSMTATVVVTP